MKIRDRILIATVTAFLSLVTLINPAIAAEPLTGVSVTLISPKPGSTINPILPMTITLQLRGGPAAKANKCDEDSLSGFEFGAQVIDNNNRAKPMRWGIENVEGYSTGGFLYGWSSKVIPGGIECTTKTGLPRRTVTAYAYFGEGFNDKDEEWFGTQQTSWSGEITNFESHKKLDIAWRTSGAVQHNVFTTTTKGSPMVEIIGLSRGQVIDYEAVFEVRTNFAASETLEYFGATAESVRVDEFLKCDEDSLGTKQVNNDGTVTYSKFCLIDFRSTDRADESLLIKSYVSTGTLEASGQAIAINIGKQGIPPCETNNEQINSQLGVILNKFRNLESRFAVLTTGAEGKKVLDSLQSLISEATSLSSQNLSVANDVSSCESAQVTLDKNLGAFLTSSKNLSTKVQKFVASPALQAKALAEAKARAKKAAAEKSAYAKTLYNYGFNLVAKMSVDQLNQLGIWKFPTPGKSALSDAQARDWCSQLPRVIVGLPNVVGYPANSNYIAGCSAAAKRVRF